MRLLIVLCTALLTSCASIGLNVGNDTTNNINNGTINVYNTNVYNTTVRTEPVSSYTSSYNHSTVDESDYTAHESLTGHIGLYADLVVSLLFGEIMSDSRYFGSSIMLSAGGEFGFSSANNRASLSAIIAVGYVYAGDVTFSSHIVRLEFGARCAFGGSTVQFYILPQAMISLGSRTSITDSYWRSSSINVDDNFGLELGIRYRGWAGFNMDVFFRLEATPITSGEIDNGDSIALFGIRLAF